MNPRLHYVSFVLLAIAAAVLGSIFGRLYAMAMEAWLR